MNWINNVVRPKIRSLLTTRREPPDDFWKKCPSCGQMSDRRTLEEARHVFPCCGHHDRLGAEARLKMVLDGGVYTRIAVPSVPTDPLRFRDGRRYTERLKDARAATGQDDAVVVAEGKLGGQDVVVAVQDFRFMGGSLGMAAGEAVVTGFTQATERGRPFIMFAASGGARMQEGILSLMQMPRTTIAAQRHREAGLPYIVVLTDPTTGGVTASYAMLGDIHIAEPGALIGFAGPRVIQQTIREQLPDGFQRAEYLLHHGMIDMVVHRHQLNATLARLVGVMMMGRAQGRRQAAGREHAPPAGHINGSVAEPKLLGKGQSEEHILIEPVADDERFGQNGKAGGKATGQAASGGKSDAGKKSAPKASPKSGP